jgi:hypothetical protein
MSTTFYHGTIKSLSILKAGSWLTKIPTHAIVQAKERAESQGGTPYILLVRAGGIDVRKPTEADRKDENRGNDFDREGWVWISTIELSVLECLTVTEAEQRFCSADNMLGPM